MRVGTFNIRHGERTDGGGVDVAALAAACAAFDVDILALQEVDRGVRRSGRRDLAAEVAEASGMAQVFGPALRTGGGQYGNALLARGSITHPAVVALPREGRTEPRVAIVATVAVGGQSVTVAATHLGLRPSESLRQLVAVAGALRERPVPRLLLGDFNRLPDLVIAPLAAAGFVVADSDLTFPAVTPRSRIDYVVVDGLTVLHTEVVATPISDHRALLAELEASP